MSQLHVFDLWLCRHVRFNFGPANESVVTDAFKKRYPALAAGLDIRDEYFEYDLLAEQRNGKYPDPAKLAAGQGKRQALLLNDDEFEQLAELPGSLELRHRMSWDSERWTSGLPEHYDRAVNCIKEIANELASTEVEVWTARSRRFADRLQHERLDLEEGVRVVQEWCHEVRRLLIAMDRKDLLPRPKWTYPTPTTLAYPVSSVHEAGPRLPKGITESDLHRVRKAIKVKGKHKGVTAINNEARMNNQKCRNILRYLEEVGEYEGFRQSKNQPKPEAKD